MLLATVSTLGALLHGAPAAVSTGRGSVHGLFTSRSRTVVLSAYPNPFSFLQDACPLSAPSPPASATTPPSPPPSLSTLLDDAESFLIKQAGLPNKPLACQAAETAIDTALRTAAEELGSLSVAVNASSSAALLLDGDLLSASIDATSIAGAGLRASSLSIVSDNVAFVQPSAFATTPPNLASPADVRFSVRLTQDDINRSPVIFGALQEILRELVRSGVSAAIGEALPRDRSGLVINLVSVEPPQAGKLVLVADAEATQSDGSVVRLSGMRVRSTPRVSAAEGNLLVLDRPELVSSFEGFGAKVELGLPFLRAAGVPLPPDVRLTRVVAADGAIVCDGGFTLRPIDYDGLVAIASAAAQDLQAAQQQQRSSTTPRWEGGDAVAVDVEATSEPPSPPPSASGDRALPPGA